MADPVRPVTSSLVYRLATAADIPALMAVIDASISGPLSAFLTPAQVEASRMIMGIDTQLIADGTYFVIETADPDGRVTITGCGGWSRRITMYGGDHMPGREPALLTPGVDPARVRAMYTDPVYVRRGVGRLILSLCEDAARAEGYTAVELVATMGGQPLYLAAGYRPIEQFEDDRGGVPVPLVRMGKAL